MTNKLLVVLFCMICLGKSLAQSPMTSSERRLQDRVDAAEGRTREQARNFDVERQNFKRTIERLNGRVFALENEKNEKGRGKQQEREETTANQRDPDTDETGRIVAMTDSEEVALLRKQAKGGSALAQTGLGVAYQYGKGVPKNRASAMKWYRMAAEQGNAQAQNNLGVMLLKGFFIARDEREAISLIARAAKQGHQTAEANLAKINENGARVVTNLEDAMR